MALAGHADAKWHVYPEQYAAGLWTTASDLARFLCEVQLALAGKSQKVLSKEMAWKMVTAGGIGSYALGFTVGSAYAHEPAQPGEAARYFGHTGGNWGFRSNLEAVNTTTCQRCFEPGCVFTPDARCVAGD